ncbi:MAG: PAS domain S-box protein, partial [Syntrophobacteraceae bacterium]
MMLVDKDCRITNINATGLAFAGKPKEESLGFLCGEVFSCINSFDSLGCGKNAPCQNCPILTKIIYTFETGQEVYDAEGRLLVRKGSTDVPVDVLISTALVKDKDADKVLVTINDITERKRVQAELFNSRQMLRSILDHIPQRVFWKDRNCVFLGCNKAFALDGGYEDPDQIVGKTSCEISSAAFADRYCADDREVMETGRPKINYEEPQIRLDGSHAWLITSKVPMYDRDGQVIGVLGTYADITERRLMEEEISQANAYLENIFENSPDAIAIVDNHGRFIRWNKMAEDLYGYTFEEMKGKSAFDLYVDKDELAKMLVSLRLEGSVRKWEMRMQRKDGSIVPFEISIGLLKDSQNETLGSVSVARDLSGIKEALAAIKASHERLFREIAERKQAEETVQRLRRRNDLILNSAGEGILGLGPEGRHTFVNPAATRMLGYTADELIGRKGHDLYHHTKEDGGLYPEEDCPIVQAFRHGKFCQVGE